MTLLDQLSKEYDYKFDDIQLIRDWIGQVFVVKKGGLRFILKIFRKQYSEAAIQSSSVMQYLKMNDFQVPSIILTVKDNSYFYTEDDNRVAILYEYIEGSEPELGHNLIKIGILSGHMRKLMEQYEHNLIKREYDYYIHRYITIISTKKSDYNQEFTEEGRKLWDRIKNSTLGFCHGDLHTGNMILSNNRINVYDFDACGLAYPIYDIATLCDGTNYFDLSEHNFTKGISKTNEQLKQFLHGYSKYYNLSIAELGILYDCIALRHFDIQATIIESQGIDCIDHDFIEKQYRWLMKWEEARSKSLSI